MSDKMRIADLRPGMSASIEGVVTAISPPREVRTKFGRETRVADAIVDDGSGSISLTLWDRDIDRIAIGDKVEVADGWVSEFKGSLQISAGRAGRIIVKESGESVPTESTAESAAAESETAESSEAEAEE